MSKILEASCVAGVVRVGALVVPGVAIFSEGVASSEGLLLLEGGEKFYISKTSPDLKTTLEQVVAALQAAADGLNQVVISSTAIGAAMTGPTTAPPPTLAADLAVITTKAAAITAARTALNILKGALK